MKKITILAANHYVDTALKKLRKLGVMHVRYINQPASREISLLENKLANLNSALAAVKGFAPREQQQCDNQQLSICIKEINSLIKQRSIFSRQLEQTQKMLQWYQQWGEVSLSSLSVLATAGLYVKLYVINKRNLKEIYLRKDVYLIRQEKDSVCIAMISTSSEEVLGFGQPVKIPEKEYRQLKREYSEIADMIEKIKTRLGYLAVYRPAYERCKANLGKEIEFYKVKSSMASEEAFKYLEGFCPYDITPRINEIAEQESWGILVQEPDNPDDVPTFLRNPHWVEIIRPVFRFMGILPGYKEYDISFWFLIFFSLFFAMLIGDAGYGLVFLMTTFFVQRKLKKIPREPFFLIYTLSIATLIWGAVTGTWFGFEKIAQLPLLNFLVIDKINSFVGTNQPFMMHLCFFIGVIHLSIAHGIVAFRYINRLICLAQIGWICIVWGMFFVVGRLVLNKPLPQAAMILLILGMSLVVLFSNPHKNIFKGMLIALGDLPLKVISSFSDIVSYLRLFAVGYAAVIMSSTFNNMAFGSGVNSIASGFLAAIALLAGHLLNIILGFMAVIIHGIRLNLLEFSGHLNMEWSGKEYAPFKE